MPALPIHQINQAVHKAPKSFAPWLLLFIGSGAVYTAYNLKTEMKSLDGARERLYARKTQREMELRRMGGVDLEEVQ